MIARFVNEPWTTGRETFATLFFRNPLSAYRAFPALMLMTIAALILGMFFKLWRDMYLAAYPANGGESLKRREFAIGTLFLFFSITALAALSWVRLILPADEAIPLDEGKTRWVTALLGFVLPFLSAAFFIKSYDLLSGSFRHGGRLISRVAIWVVLYQPTRIWKIIVRYRENLRSANLEAARLHLAEVHSADHVNAAKVLTRVQYHEGYRAGAEQIVALSKGAYSERMEPLVIARKIAGR